MLALGWETMPPLLSLIVDWLCVSIGFLLIYTACFLYEKEERLIHQTLEHAWVQIDDLKTRTVSRHLSYIRAFAAMYIRLVYRGLGTEYALLRSFNFFAFIVAATFLLFVVLGGAIYSTHLGQHLTPLGFLAIFAPCGYLVLLLGLYEDILGGRNRILVLGFNMMFLLMIGLVSYFTGRAGNASLGFGLMTVGIAISIGGFLLGVTGEVLFFVVVRKTLRIIATSESLWKVIFILTAVTCASVGIVRIPLYLFSSSVRAALPPGLHSSFLLAGGLFAISAFAILAIGVTYVILSSLALLHASLFPVINRPLYFLTRIKIVYHKKSLFVIGLTLVCLPAPGLIEPLLKALKQCCL